MKFLFRVPACLLAMTVLSLSQPLLSGAEQDKKNTQKAGQNPPMITITSRSETEDSLTVPNLEEAGKALKRIPGGVSLLNAEVYKKGRASTMKDVLDYVPGVYAQPRFGSDEARVSIRGSGIQRTFHGRGILLLQDGSPLNLADGGFDMQAVEPLAAQYVEVYRGANALFLGAANLGGAIDYITHTGYDANPVQARFEAGSFGFYKGQVSSGLVQGPFDYYATVTETARDGFQENSQQNNQRLFANVGWRVREDLENRFYLTYATTDSELPGSLTKQELESNPRQARPANVLFNNKRDFELLRLADTFAWRNDDQELALSLYWSNKDLDHPLTFAVIDQLSNDYGYNLRYQNENPVADRKNRFYAGLNQALGITEDGQFANIFGGRGARRLEDTQTATQSDLYLENQHYVTENLALVMGNQLLYATRDIDIQFTTTGARDAYKSYYAWNPKVGALYDITPRSQIYGNVSRSYEPPTFAELTNSTAGTFTTLDGQSALTAELGTRGQEGRFAWDFTVYHSWIEDELLSLNNSRGFPIGTVNATATRHLGIELGFDTDLWKGIFDKSGTGEKDGKEDRLVLRQIYNWSEFVFDSDPVYGSNQLPGLPEHVYRAELQYEHPCGFYVGPNVEWIITKTPVDQANTLFADPYALLGFKIGYRPKRGPAVFFEAKNLTDSTYAATTGVIADARTVRGPNTQFNPGDGRGYYGGVEFRW